MTTTYRSKAKRASSSTPKKRRRRRSSDSPPPARRRPTRTVEPDVWEVEYILEMSAQRNEAGTHWIWQYLVKWLGWEHNDNTWEPKESFVDADDVLESFWEDIRAKYAGLTTRHAFKHVGEQFVPSLAWIERRKKDALVATDMIIKPWPDSRGVSPAQERSSASDSKWIATRNERLARGEDDGYTSQSGEEEEDDDGDLSGDDTDDDDDAASVAMSVGGVSLEDWACVPSDEDEFRDDGLETEFVYRLPGHSRNKHRDVARIPPNPHRCHRKDKAQRDTEQHAQQKTPSRFLNDRRDKYGHLHGPSTTKFVTGRREYSIVRANKKHQLVSHRRGRTRARAKPVRLFTDEERMLLYLDGERKHEEWLRSLTAYASDARRCEVPAHDVFGPVVLFEDSVPQPVPEPSPSFVPAEPAAAPEREEHLPAPAPALGGIHPDRLALMQQEPAAPASPAMPPAFDPSAAVSGVNAIVCGPMRRAFSGVRPGDAPGVDAREWAGVRTFESEFAVLDNAFEFQPGPTFEGSVQSAPAMSSPPQHAKTAVQRLEAHGSAGMQVDEQEEGEIFEDRVPVLAPSPAEHAPAELGFGDYINEAALDQRPDRNAPAIPAQSEKSAPFSTGDTRTTASTLSSRASQPDAPPASVEASVEIHATENVPIDEWEEGEIDEALEKQAELTGFQKDLVAELAAERDD